MKNWNGGPGGTRTRDLRITNPVLSWFQRVLAKHGAGPKTLGFLLSYWPVENNPGGYGTRSPRELSYLLLVLRLDGVKQNAFNPYQLA